MLRPYTFGTPLFADRHVAGRGQSAALEGFAVGPGAPPEFGGANGHRFLGHGDGGLASAVQRVPNQAANPEEHDVTRWRREQRPFAAPSTAVRWRF